MAKNGQQRNYMQVFIPNGNGSRYSSEQALMYGLDNRGTADSLTMESCSNINVKSLPYIESCEKPKITDINLSSYGAVVGFYAYDGNAFVICYNPTSNTASLIRIYDSKIAAVTTWNPKDEDKGVNREMAVFCYYPISVSKMAYETTPEYYLLIYPDQKYIKAEFNTGDPANIIAPARDYKKSTAKKHILGFGATAIDLELLMTIFDDGTVSIESGSEVDAFFEGCDVRVTFTDESKNAYVGKVAVKGTASFKTEGFGVFLSKVYGNTAELRLKGARSTGEADQTFYVMDDSSGGVVYSEGIDVGTSNVDKTFVVNNLVAGRKYYAYIDYNDNRTRYDLTFTLADKAETGELKIDGKLFDMSGNPLKLDRSKEYAVSYNISNNIDESYTAAPASEDEQFTIQLGSTVSTTKSVSPRFQHITVWNSRLFGTRDNVVVCSSAGTPFDWTLDSPESEPDSYGLTVGGYDESHAWYSTTQANTKASGDVTAITSFDGHPVIFKDDFMHEVYNTKNPFRIQDICAVGCVSARSVCELDSVLYFASRDGIYRYAGGYPKRISDALADFTCGDRTICGALDGVLYVYNPDYADYLIYSYNPESGYWSAIENPFVETTQKGEKVSLIISFASSADRLYLISENGKISYLDKESSTSGAIWSFDTNVNLFGTSGDKRIHSLMIVHDGDSPSVKINDKEVNAGETSKAANKTRVLIRGFDSERIKLSVSGEGYTKIHRIDIVYSVSGRRYKK